jgi:hypothetical protein
MLCPDRREGRAQEAGHSRTYNNSRARELVAGTLVQTLLGSLVLSCVNCSLCYVLATACWACALLARPA